VSEGRSLADELNRRRSEQHGAGRIRYRELLERGHDPEAGDAAGSAGLALRPKPSPGSNLRAVARIPLVWPSPESTKPPRTCAIPGARDQCCRE